MRRLLKRKRRSLRGNQKGRLLAFPVNFFGSGFLVRGGAALCPRKSGLFCLAGFLIWRYSLDGYSALQSCAVNAGKTNRCAFLGNAVEFPGLFFWYILPYWYADEKAKTGDYGGCNRTPSNIQVSSVC